MPFVLRGQETVKFDTLVLRLNSRKRHDKQAAKRWLPLGLRPVVSWQLIPPLADKSPSAALL